MVTGEGRKGHRAQKLSLMVWIFQLSETRVMPLTGTWPDYQAAREASGCL